MRKIWMLAGLLMCGCSGSVQSSIDWSSSDDDADAGPVGPTNTCPTTDGGPIVNVYHHQSPSWVLTNPQVHLVFWGNYWATVQGGKQEMAAQMVEWNTLASDPNFYGLVSQYGVGTGTYAGTINSYWQIPTGQLSEQAIQTELTNEIANSVLPTPDSNTIFILLLPPDTQGQYDVQNNFGGHHWNQNGYTYATIEYTGDPTGTIAHETWEAATDPDGNGWWGPGGETEVADLCKGNSSWSLDGYTLPTVWSQKDCQCEP
jgi:hypothetical protein